MKEIKAYKIEQKDITGEFDDSEMIVFIPSGYKNVWLMVTEDPAYNIHVRYANDKEVKKFKLNENGNN